MNTYRFPLLAARLRAGLLHLILALATLSGATRALAQATPAPPDRMTYQGFLTDSSGTPLGNAAPKNYDVIFRIWKSESSTSTSDRLWTEQQTVTVDKGYFSVLLGEGGNIGEPKPALSTVFSGADASDRWVSITVKGIGAGGAEVNILPRLRLLTSPYAFLAAKAIAVDGAGVTSGTIQDARLSSNVAFRAGGNTFSGAQTINGNLTVGGTQTFTGNQTLNGNQTVNGNVNASTVTATSFNGRGTIPIGGIIMWSGSTVPSGWALCDGSNGRPDLRGRFVLGSGNGPGLTARSIGQTGGAQSVALSVSEMPAHTHSVNPPRTETELGGYHNHTMDADFGGGVGGSGNDKVVYNSDGNDSSHSTDYGGSHTHFIDLPATTSTSAGSGLAHENMPPFYVLAFIIRVQ